MSPDGALKATCALTSTGLAIGSAEWLRLSGNAIARTALSVFSSVNGLPLFLSRAVLSGRMASAAGVLVGVFYAPLFTPSVVVVVVFSVLTLLLHPLGLEAADFIALGTFLVVAANRLRPAEIDARTACILACIMVSLSYTAAGACKFFSDVWGTGKAIPAVLKTVAFGTPALAPHIEGMAFTRYAERVVISAELGFPLVLLLPGWATLALLCGLAFFHLLIALTMGLNLFFWAYVAVLPCVYCVSQTLTGG
ncbi:hypothetical protein ABZ619_18355 [Streptomyces sp. NPDC007851]|uniref:hypothetical protein n=1 Tax=Streptomyces sp. NPDC007851 TaxID=3155008 RepID=UPI0033D70FC1